MVVSLLNEKGNQVLELKKALIQFSNNPLIYTSLLSTVESGTYESKIKNALLNSSCSEKTFQTILMGFDTYANIELIKKSYTDFMKKITLALEKKGKKYFSTSLAIEEGGIKVFKKIGINIDFIRREFRITESEAKKLEKDGFLEKYAQLKLNGILKNIKDEIVLQFGKEALLTFSISPFYHVEFSSYYNMDFNIIVKLSDEVLNPKTSTAFKLSPFNRLIDVIGGVLSVVDKEFHKKVNS